MGNTGLCSNTNLLQVIHIVRTVINILQIAVPVALISHLISPPNI